MADIKSAQELQNEYIEYQKQYELALGRVEKDENSRIEARRYAQRCLGLAITLRRRFDEISIENQKYKINADWYANQIPAWEKKLKGLGSSMSGIPTTTFDDVAGLEDVKAAIRNYLFALKNPEVAQKYKISTSAGMLLYGPPGTGKTLVAEAIANALGVRFFVITPSDVFGSYVGESERNIREIFSEIRACEDGAVLLVDECESIFSRRTGESNRSTIGVANQLLQEMNGAGGTQDKRLIIGATNCPEQIDEAYLRYKRFSMQFYIGMPAPEARQKIIKMKLAGIPCEPSVEAEMIRRLDGSFTCADISGIIEQCAYRAMQDYRAACEREGMGAECVRVSLRHLNEVLAVYPKSVTPSDLARYTAFRDARLSGK